MKVSMIQYDIVFGNPKENYKKVEQLIKQAVDSKPDILILPELWTTGYDLNRLDEIADEDAQDTIKFISNLAEQYTVNIIAGSIAKRMGGKVNNTMLVFNSTGKLVHEYSKAHLFRLMDEDKHLIEGNSKALFSLAGVLSAGFICYDIRFPEWIRKHAVEGAKIIFVSAEWPKPRIDHWKYLLIARAIENQCYIVACNRSGSDPANVFGGHSIVIDPWGHVVEEASENESIVTAVLETELVDEVRSKIPVFEDRRIDLY
ncbi:carbon-nitrogen family hydrolase [Aquibacillus koreensis]|uniref:Carbon-nitrogen family hydrolase n=1 Tax=Aquibacillus koreensis TaxID=279446 RepID=A0A9X4AII3_9BACI|nr:carbon-nitrogen family hydrolase [Aquibacillus koreensis]MCT2535157.1 carbon-nitrogen family hydrolase [Aquibacillus koreensis]MDC3421016.1 carbon-nitrogen family hydrolase [Aquibacillus koreensis]